MQSTIFCLSTVKKGGFFIEVKIIIMQYYKVLTISVEKEKPLFSIYKQYILNGRKPTWEA